MISAATIPRSSLPDESFMDDDSTPEDIYLPALVVEFEPNTEHKKFQKLVDEEPMVQCDAFLRSMAEEDSHFYHTLLEDEDMIPFFKKLINFFDDKEMRDHVHIHGFGDQHTMYLTIENAMRRRLEFAIRQKKRFLYWAPVMHQSTLEEKLDMEVNLKMVNKELDLALHYVTGWSDISSKLELLVPAGMRIMDEVPESMPDYKDQYMEWGGTEEDALAAMAELQNKGDAMDTETEKETEKVDDMSHHFAKAKEISMEEHIAAGADRSSRSRSSVAVGLKRESDEAVGGDDESSTKKSKE